MAKQTAERRAHARFPRSFVVDASTDGTVARMEARDLSLGGLYCSSSTDFPEMTRLGVTLLLPNGHDTPAALDVEAVVVRRKKLAAVAGGSRYELALFFTQMSDTQRESIARFLARSA